MNKQKWLSQCQDWKNRYPVCLPEYEHETEGINCYWFLDKLSDIAPDDAIIVTDMGSSFTASYQAWKIKKGQRLITSSGHAPMGWGLPGAIGAAFASGKPVICITGDGGIMMNLQELATIAKHNLPICIFLLDNSGYLTIKHMQRNHFGRFVGSTEDSLGFPNWEELAKAFKIEYHVLNKLHKFYPQHIKTKPCLARIKMPPHQSLIPRNTSEKRPDGTLVSKPLEDMYPFLPRSIFKAEMLVPAVDILKE